MFLTHPAQRYGVLTSEGRCKSPSRPGIIVDQEMIWHVAALADLRRKGYLVVKIVSNSPEARQSESVGAIKPVVPRVQPHLRAVDNPTKLRDETSVIVRR